MAPAGIWAGPPRPVTWSERGGPPVKAPEHEGFGTRLITSLTRQLGGGYEVSYAASGIVCDIRLVTRPDDVTPEQDA